MSFQLSTVEYQLAKSSVFNIHLNTWYDNARGGKLKPARYAMTGNVLTPIVECFDCRMMIAA